VEDWKFAVAIGRKLPKLGFGVRGQITSSSVGTFSLIVSFSLADRTRRYYSPHTALL
jgi:uncharacterized PurR-regulated membrane protein YhhQ (DUF165 family)